MQPWINIDINLAPWFPTRFDTNWTVQSQRVVTEFLDFEKRGNVVSM